MYKLPINPIDLTKIYKQKIEDTKFTLKVDYLKSKEVLTVKQILIYLSNTGFRCSFDTIDNELIDTYIELNFLVDCPQLSRLVGNIIKSRLGHPIVEPHEIDLIDNCTSLTINDLIEDLSGLPAFIIDSSNSLDEGNLTIDIEVNAVATDSLVGLNILNIILDSTDALFAVFTTLGFKYDYNSSIYNDSSKYGGVDILSALESKGILKLVLSTIPNELICERTPK
jgi:hypothetical protein